jgi:predicted aldo/keto reductase-like oxidoreductase
VLSQDVAVVVPGYSSVREVEVAANVGRNYVGLSADEKRRFNVELGDYCRDCGECQPCPQGLNVPAILRFCQFGETFGLRDWAKKLYEGLEVDVEKCTECRECEQRCPYRLPVMSKLREAKAKFT